jgi:hypothetical protein
MKKKSLVLLMTLLITASCQKDEESIAPSKIETISTNQVGATIGSAISTTITASGGTASLLGLGAKVIVPAGAMTTGSKLIIQEISNVVNTKEKAMRITGDWTKNITVEYQAPDNEPDSYNVFVGFLNGVWGGPRNPKVSGKTLSVRLGPNSGPTIKNGKVSANKPYDLVFAKVFTVKPDIATLDLGKSQQFTAYAKEGFIPRKGIVVGKIYTDEAEWLADLKENTAANIRIADDDNEPAGDDDDVVPLKPIIPTPSKDDDDEPVVPLRYLAKAYPFANSKAGFKRTWTVTGVGAVSNSGKYTAPKEETAKGKTAKITFTSINETTKAIVSSDAIVYIKDGLGRYRGTATTTESFDYTDIVTGTKRIRKLSYSFSFVLVANPADENEFRVDPAQSTAVKTEHTTHVISKNATVAENGTNLISSGISNGKTRGTLNFKPNSKQYELSISFDVEGEYLEQWQVLSPTSTTPNKRESEKRGPLSNTYGFTISPISSQAPKYSDINQLSGSLTRSIPDTSDEPKITTIITTWQLSKVE